MEEPLWSVVEGNRKRAISKSTALYDSVCFLGWTDIFLHLLYLGQRFSGLSMTFPSVQGCVFVCVSWAHSGGLIIRSEPKIRTLLTAQQEHWLATHIFVADIWQLLKSVPYHRRC